MLRFYQNSKVYVLAPTGVVTGGAELLHQLVDYLRKHNREAYIHYIGEGPQDVPEEYRCYDILTSEIVEDDERNIVVLNEGIFDKATLFPLSQKVFWWLSVDHFYTLNKDKLSPFDYIKYNRSKGIKLFIKLLLELLMGHNLFEGRMSIMQLKSYNAVNAYQSEYAQWWLLKNGFQNVVPLKDYVNMEHCCIKPTAARKDIILYNPKKGLNYTQRIIAASPDLKWVPLCGFKRNELINIIDQAKLYVDFGYHPGKDRLPRECAIHGCCVITGRQGSANFYEDVPISDRYKFDERQAKISEIVDTIRWILDNYEIAHSDFSFYRQCVLLEKEEFDIQVNRIFELPQ